MAVTPGPVKRLVVHFARFGPYHLARIEAARQALASFDWDVGGLETGGGDDTYAWREEDGPTAWQRVTVFPGEAAEKIPAARLRAGMTAALDQLKPDAVAIAGWGSPDARACLDWCKRHGAKAIVMSETREADGVRVWWKEWLKSRIIRRFDAALVGGRSHRDYLVKLGMAVGKVAFGYNVVDNAYFAAEAAKWEKLKAETLKAEIEEGREEEDGRRPPYFLASNRFIERKNLGRLVEAYGRYAQRSQGAGDWGQGTGGASQESGSGSQGTGSGSQDAGCERQMAADNGQRTTDIWPLVLLGDGELKGELIAQCRELGLHVAECAPWEEGGKAESGMRMEHQRQQSQAKPRMHGVSEARAKQKAEGGVGNAGSSFQLSNFSVSAFSRPTVFFPGFRQIEELPRFYAQAGCFVHPALEEPWGLVINEAMACGLPILSGSNVGAAEELVDDGVNGWNFDATDVDAMAEAMLKISAFNFHLSTFGEASRRLLEERCPTQAFGRGLAELLSSGS